MAAKRIVFVRVGLQRSGAGPERIEAVPGRDIVALHISNGPTLLLHPENARDLMLAQGGTRRGRAAAPGEVEVPARLQWRGLEEASAARGIGRGLLGEVVVSALEVITGTSTGGAADLAASKVVARVDAQVDPGVYRLAPAELPMLKGSGAGLEQVPAAGDAPLLVLVHGTFSTTRGTFGKFWTEHPALVRRLFDAYGGRVYGLEHATLGEGPIANALTLARALPDGARVHLLTHSRGGLVAEVLARVCEKPQLSKADLAPFSGKGYARQLADLKALAAVVRDKGLRVERLVRVACPARGTLLASKRLDAYVSVFRWALELAKVPVAPEIVEFLGEVARRRADPERIPGLAAQIPDSPLIQWLHAAPAPIAGDLRVIAGDLEGDSVVSWVKTLLADAYYRTDNDLVVQTSSMYGGSPRAAGASFVLDQGGAVSHFSYFSNEATAEAIVEALVKAEPAGFRAIGPLSWAGQSSTGVRARGPADGKPLNAKPAVFVLPGILGSNLKRDDARIWLSWRLVNGLKRLEYRPPKDGIEPDGPVERVYGDLAGFLARTHEVVEFAFDWRKPLEEEARRLAKEISAALAARKKTGRPVRILAHSMGGLVARAMQLEEPAVWDRMMAVPGARLLMLGTPNAGSWAPMQVLSGDDTLGNALAAIGAPFQDHAARRMMARFPGLIQLQAALQDPALGLDREASWQKLADEDLARVRERNWWHDEAIQLAEYTWGVPPQGVLDQAVALRKRLDAQARGDLGAFTDRMLLVVGHAARTPDGCEMGPGGLVYLDAREHGDGRVTLASARLPGVRTWKLDCEHGSLPSERGAFDAYLELLETGTTQRLDPLADAPAPAASHVRSRPSRAPSFRQPPASPAEVLSIAARADAAVHGRARGAALRVTVANGNLMFVGAPLMIGHYRSTRLWGTERVMDALVGEAMSASLATGNYPSAPGMQDVFMTRPPAGDARGMPRPGAVIVVGLGEEGKLRGSELALTVQHGAIEWAKREREKPAPPSTFALAATLIGSGGTGISPAQSAQLVAQGVADANAHLDRIGWPRVDRLVLIELYLDRASEAQRALQLQADADPGQYRVDDAIEAAIGGLRRPLDQGYRGAEYDFITAKSLADEGGEAFIQYTLDMRRARTEVRGQMTQGRLVKALVEKASNERNADPQIGRTLFQLLVPAEMDPFLGGSSEMVIELDRGTAGIPWELLDTREGGGPSREPWAIRAKLVRKLAIAEFRRQGVDAGADAGILVIGEPKADPAIYPRLPGARAEARAVYAALTAPGAVPAELVKALISPEDPDRFGPDERAVANAILGQDWRIVHIAGHGEPPENDGGDPRGVVLSDTLFLGPREIEAMRVVPELVFVNCCHLAASSPGQLLAQEQWRLGRHFSRPEFASSVAGKLIDIGVRCVVAAGWAVDDDAASAFATAFYGALLRGRRFMDAVAEARKRSREKGGNTWAAYQCYGDPDWSLRLPGVSRESRAAPPADRFSGVTSAIALSLALEAITMSLRYPRPQAQAQRAAQVEGHRADLRFLEERFAPRWGGTGFVAEAFGDAWGEAGEAARAKAWYRRAVKAKDGSATLRAAASLKR